MWTPGTVSTAQVEILGVHVDSAPPPKRWIKAECPRHGQFLGRYKAVVVFQVERTLNPITEAIA